jgi:hypothetical protein
MYYLTMSARTVLHIVFVVVAVLILAGILLPAGGEGAHSRKGEAYSMETSLVSALKAYRIDYGRFPAVRADGCYETAADNAKLIRVLCALDTTDNTQKIVYFEAMSIRSKNTRRSGIDPQGVLLDPWGNPYRIRVDTDWDDKVQNPYKDTRHSFLNESVIVWSVGKDGIQGPTDAKGILSATSDDVMSWKW